jgi:hypothetical protein
VHEVGPPAAGGGGEEVVDERLAGVQQPADVRVHHRRPLSGLGGGERRAEHHAGVGDHEVGPAELGADRGRGAGEARRVRDVGGHGDAVDLLRERLDAVGASGEHRDAGAARGQRPRGGGADPAAGPGDDGDASGEVVDVLGRGALGHGTEPARGAVGRGRPRGRG